MTRKKLRSKKIQKSLDKNQEINDPLSFDNNNDDIEEDSVGSEAVNDEYESSNQKRKLFEKEEEINFGNPGKKVKTHSGSKTSNYIKPPTSDELQRFRETQFLQHSNLFRLQVEELLANVEIKQKTKVLINAWIFDLAKLLKSLPSMPQRSFKELGILESLGIDQPILLSEDFSPSKGSFSFAPPQDISIIGSFAVNLATLHSTTLDLALILPKACCQKKDFCGGIWLARRAIYLAWIGKALKNAPELISSVSWTRQFGCPLRPVLQVKPAGDLNSKWSFNLYAVPPLERSKVSPLCCLESNVASSWTTYRLPKSSASSPAPFSSWLCAIDTVVIKHRSYIEENLKHVNWLQGLKLLKIWLSQRNLNQGEGGVSSHAMTFLVLLLAKLRKISPVMSPYQVFRAALLYITQTDWRISGPSFPESKSEVKSNKGNINTHLFHEYYPVVFLDPDATFNLVGNVDVTTYLELIYEAKIGLEFLELSSTKSFDSLFIQKVEFHLKYDQFLQIRLDKKLLEEIFNSDKIGIKGKKELVKMDYFRDLRLPVHCGILSTLSEALNDRVELVGLKRTPSAIWFYGKSVPQSSPSLSVGLVIHPINSAALLTKGPSADTKEASIFREFWGEISSLRRFKDSTFHEAVLWLDSGEPMGDRRLIIGLISNHILKRHFNINEDSISYVAGQMETAVRRKYSFNNENFKYGTGEELISSAIISFDRLSKKLRSLELPLQITGIQSNSDILSHTCVFPPMPSLMPRPFLSSKQAKMSTSPLFSILSDEKALCPFYRPSIDVQIFMEISGKWPDDLVAIKAIKCEFLLRIAEALKEGGYTAVLFPSFLLVIWEGYIFKLRVCYRREIFILRNSGPEIMPKQNGVAETEASVQLEKDIEILPRLISSLSSLQSDFPSFSCASRLIKRWTCSQLLQPHFPPIVTSLIVAYLYLSPNPYKAPSSPHVALLRFMNMMVSTDWKNTPLFVNLRDEFTVSDETYLMEKFTSDRCSFPPIFICSPSELRPLPANGEVCEEDLSKRYLLASCWSREGPLLPILSRMKVVCKAGLEVISSIMWRKNENFMVLFRPPLDWFDVTIHLNYRRLTRAPQRIDVKSKNLKSYEHVKGEQLPAYDFDPVQNYLRELKKSYGVHALFFHDEFGGQVIGVIWKPHVSLEAPPKIGILEGHRLSGVNAVKQFVDVEAILEGFSILGQDLVDEVKLLL